MIILGIETSCDETALALIETKGQGKNREYRIIQSLIHSQAELHNQYGGVFPTLAKREHSKNLLPLLGQILKYTKTRKEINQEEWLKKLNLFKKKFGEQNADLIQTFKQSGIHDMPTRSVNAGSIMEVLKKIPNIDQIAVTEGPGLEPTLWVGITFAKILSLLWDIPVIPINHMEGHIIGSLLKSDQPSKKWQKLEKLPLPAVALLISGGHTELVKIGAGKKKSSKFIYEIIGQTRDDAVGEAFDKTARLLGLPYPGGPQISLLANQAREQNIVSKIKLPRPMINTKDLDFSFSGLKTAVLYAVRAEQKESGKINLDNKFRLGLARELEDSISEVLDKKLRNCIKERKIKAIIVGGGVSANQSIQRKLTNTAKEYDLPIFLPSRHISGDNALMIALAGSFKKFKKIKVKIIADGTKSLENI